MAETEPLKLLLQPGEYQCEAYWPEADGSVAKLPGSLELVSGKPASIVLYGEVPLKFDRSAPSGLSMGFPQISQLPRLHVVLANGYEALMLNCTAQVSPSGLLMKLTEDGTVRRQAWITAAGTMVGPWRIRTDQTDLVDRMRIQVTGSDGLIARRPIDAVAFPTVREPGVPVQWSVVESIPRTSEDADDNAMVTGSWNCSYSAPNGYEHRVSFSPVIDVSLSEPVSLEQLIVDWIEPIYRIVGLSTGRTESITFLSVHFADADERNYHQVFGPNITQQPYASKAREVSRIEYFFTCYKPEDSTLLSLCRGWQNATHLHHPLIETLAAFMYLPKQHARPRFLLACQALEGLYGFDNQEKIRERQESHSLQRKDALEKIAACESIDKATGRFLKSALANRPFSSLEVPLRDSVKRLPVDGSAKIDELAIVKAVKQSNGPQNVPDWAAAFRIVRNDLSHGSRSWDSEVLEPASDLLEGVALAHLMDVIGCSPASVARVSGFGVPQDHPSVAKREVLGENTAEGPLARLCRCWRRRWSYFIDSFRHGKRRK